MDVPKETTVRPITSGDTPYRDARTVPPLTRKSAATTSRANPDTVKTTSTITAYSLKFASYRCRFARRVISCPVTRRARQYYTANIAGACVSWSAAVLRLKCTARGLRYSMGRRNPGAGPPGTSSQLLVAISKVQYSATRLLLSCGAESRARTRHAGIITRSYCRLQAAGLTCGSLPDPPRRITGESS